MKTDAFRIVESRHALPLYEIEARCWSGSSYRWTLVGVAYTIWGAKRRIKRLARAALLAQEPMKVLYEETI